MQLLGCPRDVLMPRHGQKIFQHTKLHAYTPVSAFQNSDKLCSLMNNPHSLFLRTFPCNHAFVTKRIQCIANATLRQAAQRCHFIQGNAVIFLDKNQQFLFRITQFNFCVSFCAGVAVFCASPYRFCASFYVSIYLFCASALPFCVSMGLPITLIPVQIFDCCLVQIGKYCQSFPQAFSLMHARNACP